MLAFPDAPEVPSSQRASGRVSIRFEDVTQDGRLGLEALSPAVGEVVWAKLLVGSPLLKALRAQQIVPIFTRIVMQASDGPFSTAGPMEADGLYQLAHTRNANDEVERVVLDMWIDATLPIGRNYGPPPADAGKRVHAGRLFAEHVLTRLFAPPDKRKVTGFDMNGAAASLGDARPAVAPESVATLPPGAVPLDPQLKLDPTPICFGLAHTDSNQHVNSLVYPRLFEDAALRRFAEHGRLQPPVLARHGEAAFRKPCFAGERYAIAVQAFELQGKLGAIGTFVSEADARSTWSMAKARPHCFLRMLFA